MNRQDETKTLFIQHGGVMRNSELVFNDIPANGDFQCTVDQGMVTDNGVGHAKAKCFVLLQF